MTAQEETKVAQMQCAYEDKIKELEAELAEIHRLSGIIDSACNSRTNNLT